MLRCVFSVLAGTVVSARKGRQNAAVRYVSSAAGLRPAAGSGWCREGLGGTVRVGCVPQVDAVGDRKVEHLLQLGVHALLVAPEELVAPCPVAGAPSGAHLLSPSKSSPDDKLRLEDRQQTRQPVGGRHTRCRGPSGVPSAAPWGAHRRRGSPGSPWGSDPAERALSCTHLRVSSHNILCKSSKPDQRPPKSNGCSTLQRTMGATRQAPLGYGDCIFCQTSQEVGSLS